jgi:hypothetical protein
LASDHFVETGFTFDFGLHPENSAEMR